MKKVLITQSNYIPWKGYFDAIAIADEFVVYDDMQYTRRDWRNRNLIKTKNGLEWLTIPVEVKGKYFQKIRDTKISDPKWAIKHWSIISQNYAKAKYFNEFKEEFEEAYLNNQRIYLSEINLDFILLINRILKIKTKIRTSYEFNPSDHKTGRLVDICQKLGASDYYTGPAAKNYMDENLFSLKGIKINYMDYSNYPEYPQLFATFEHSVSVLDLIFNAGPNSRKFLKNV